MLHLRNDIILTSLFTINSYKITIFQGKLKWQWKVIQHSEGPPFDLSSSLDGGVSLPRY